MLTHEHSLVASGGKHCGILRTGYSRLGDPHHAGRHLRGHTHGASGVDGEGHEIALVHPDEIGAGGDGPIQFRLIVDLNERIETNVASQGKEGFEFLLIECCSNEKHTIGTHETGVADITRTDREVLAQHRQRAGRAGGDEIGLRSPEELDISEN